MTREEIAERQSKWAESEMGKLFYAFERTLGAAWREDTILGERDGSDRAAKAAWERHDKARVAFLTALRGW